MEEWMQNRSYLRYIMFGLLYFTQGTVLSYFTALNGIYFLENGLTMADVGIFASIALIPFVIKIFMGMLSDKVNFFGLGHRKPYIFIGLAIQIIGLIIAPFIQLPGGYWSFVVLAFCLQMGMALYDTCTDGFALDTTPDSEKGIIQGFMVGGRALGVVATASVVGLLAERAGWSAVFWLLAGLTLLPIPFVILQKEPERSQDRAFNWKAFSSFKDSSVLALAGIGFIFFVVIAGANQNVNPFLESQFNINLSTAGFFTTVWGIGVVAGSALGGWLITKLGDRNSARISIGISMVATLSLAGILSIGIAWPIVIAFGLSYGIYQTVYFALAMEYTVHQIAASMYAIMMAVTNVGQGVGMALSGFLANSIGFRWAFIILAAINVLAFPLFSLAFRKHETSRSVS
jgi:PAT family beta-lactamase induction signal transducer AmpG